MTAFIVVILVLLAVVVVMNQFVFPNTGYSKQSVEVEHLDETQDVRYQRKVEKQVNSEQSKRSATVGKTDAKKSIGIGDATAILAGAALAHHVIKDHKHDNRDVGGDYVYPYDDELDELDVLDYLDVLDDLDMLGDEETFDYYDDVKCGDNACYDDDLDAYDDYVASLD